MSICISFTVPGPEAPKFKERIQKEAMKQGMSMSELVVEAIAEFIRKGSARKPHES